MNYLVKNITVNHGQTYDVAVPNILLSINCVHQFLRTDCTHQREWNYDVIALNDLQVTDVSSQWDENICCDLADHSYDCGDTVLWVRPVHSSQLVINVTDREIEENGGTLDDVITDKVLHILAVGFIYTETEGGTINGKSVRTVVKSHPYNILSVK